MLKTLRRVDGALVLPLPEVFVDRNRLHEGSQVDLQLKDSFMIIKAIRHSRHRLEDLLDYPGFA